MGNELLVAIGGTAVFVVLLVVFMIFIVLKFQQNKAKSQRERLELQSRFSAEILKSQIEIQNETLKGVGDELHDNLGQILSVLKINLNAADDETTFEGLREATKNCLEISDKAIKELRALSKSLTGDYAMNLGIKEAILQDLERLKRTKRFTYKFDAAGWADTLNSNKRVVFFRIFQEATNNIIKHSMSKHIEIHLSKSTEFHTILKIMDFGKGFDHENIENLDGSGLRNMKRRAELIGAKYQIFSQPNLGTTITLSL